MNVGFTQRWYTRQKPWFPLTLVTASMPFWAGPTEVVPQRYRFTVSKTRQPGADFFNLRRCLCVVIEILTYEERERERDFGYSDSVMVSAMTMTIILNPQKGCFLRMSPTLWEWPCLKANPSSTSQNCFS